MQCPEFEARLHSLLDDRQSPEADATLVAHAAGCEPCNQLLVGQRLLLAGLRRGVSQSPGSHFALQSIEQYKSEPMEAVVLAQALSDGGPVRHTTWQVLAWLAATAAALAIAVSIYLASHAGRSKVAETLPGPKNAQPVRPHVPDRGLAQNDPHPGSGRRGP